MQPSPDNDHCFRISRKVFRYDDVLTAWGWSHDVYYDAKSGMWLIVDFPEPGRIFEMSFPPEIGEGEIVIGDTVYEIRVFEP